jgi:MFS family permease
MASPLSTWSTGLATVGFAVGAVGLATTIPLPLYGRFAAAGGYGAGALALAFSCYAAALIVTAPLLGPLPDRIGRKPCVLIGLLLAALSTCALSLQPGIPALAVARMAQGLAMGCVAGAATAWAAELAGGGEAGARRGAAVIALATIGSFSAGGLLTLLAVVLMPVTMPPWTFPAHLLACGILLMLTDRLPETLPADLRATARGWLRLPAFPRGTWPTTLAIIPGWGTTGTVLTSVQGSLNEAGMPLAGPAAACAMMLVGVLAQQATRRIAPGRAVAIGLPVLVAGAGLTLWGAAAVELWPLLLGGAVVGIGTYAFIYPGGLATVSVAATGEERARAIAGYFVIAHIGFSAVPLAVGLAVDRFGATAALSATWIAIALTAGLLMPPILAANRSKEPA